MKKEEIYNTSWLAKKTNLSMTTIRRLAPQVPGASNPSGSGWVFLETAVEWVKDREETRGRKKIKVTIDDKSKKD